MAYKRSSKSTPGGTKTTTTHNNKGSGAVTSVSKRSGNQRVTRTSNSKTGASYQTTTRNLGNGWIERKRVRTSPSKVKPFNWSKFLGVDKKKKTAVKSSSAEKGAIIKTTSVPTKDNILVTFVSWSIVGYFIYFIYSFFA